LKKYDGLTFTESETPEIRKTLAELRKGAKAGDRYRFDTKKEVSEPITEFEKKCKESVKKFDERIGSLDEHLKDYEKQWKENRIVKVQEVIANVLNESNLKEKYAARLVVDDDHLKKNVTDNRLREMIEFQADGLLQEQEKEQADRDMIETYVKLKNSEYSVNLSFESYLSQLEFKDAQSVKNTIKKDVENELARREREMERKAQKEAEKKREEELKFEKQDYAVDDIPFEPSMSEIDEPEEDSNGNGIIKEYEVIATKEKHDMLFEFMKNNDISFNQITTEELPF